MFHFRFAPRCCREGGGCDPPAHPAPGRGENAHAAVWGSGPAALGRWRPPSPSSVLQLKDTPGWV